MIRNRWNQWNLFLFIENQYENNLHSFEYSSSHSFQLTLILDFTIVYIRRRTDRDLTIMKSEALDMWKDTFQVSFDMNNFSCEKSVFKDCPKPDNIRPLWVDLTIRRTVVLIRTNSVSWFLRRCIFPSISHSPHVIRLKSLARKADIRASVREKFFDSYELTLYRKSV